MQFLSHRLLQSGIHTVGKSLDLLRSILQHAKSEQLQISRPKRQASSKHFVCDDPQRVLVRQSILFPSLPLLRGKIGKFDFRP